MTDRDLRKLSRRDLLELLVQQEQQKEILEARVAHLEERLNNRSIEIDNAGSIAEAALILNGVFENAEKAAAQYLENIKHCSEQQESIYNRIVSEAEQKAKAIINNAEIEKQQEMEAADAYWKELSNKLEVFYQEHIGLRELLSVQSRKETSENR